MDTASVAGRTPMNTQLVSASRHLIRGVVKLSIALEDGSLLVNVDRAQRLKIKEGDNSRTFIKVCLRNGSRSEQTQQTRVVFHQSSPQFKETFKFYTTGGDLKRRLFLEIVQSDPVTSQWQSAGCMSFGLQHLLAKLESKMAPLSGYYYVLDDALGTRKHVFAGSTETTMAPRHAPDGARGQGGAVGAGHCSARDGSGLTGTAHTFVLHHGPTGYGFTLQGSCPTRVATVKPSGAARSSGLISGDVILRVNGNDVTDASSNDVASMVRYSPHHQVVLEIQRLAMHDGQHKSSTTRQRDIENTGEQTASKQGVYETLTSPNVGCISKAILRRKHKAQLEASDGKVYKSHAVKTKKGFGCGVIRATRVLPASQKRHKHPVEKENHPPVVPSRPRSNRLTSHEHHSNSSVNSSLISDVTATRCYNVVEDYLKNSTNGTHHHHDNDVTSLPGEHAASGRWDWSDASDFNDFAKPCSPRECGEEMSFVHQWLDSVGQDSEMLRKDGAFSNAGTSPESGSTQTSPENSALFNNDTALSVTLINNADASLTYPSPASCLSEDETLGEVAPPSQRLAPTPHLMSEDSLKWDPCISIIEHSCEDQKFCDSADIASGADNEDESNLDLAFSVAELDQLESDDQPSLCSYNSFLDTTASRIETSNFCHLNSNRMIDSSCSATLQSFNMWPPEVTFLGGQDTDGLSDHHTDTSPKDLVELESNYVQFMQWGMGRFSRPLRHAILTPAQHLIIFQNIEKLVALSEYHYRQLQNDLEYDGMTLALNVYRPGLKMLCEAYNKYLGGLTAARQLFHQLEAENQHLAEFLGWWPEDGKQWCSLHKFISQPIKHLARLVTTFEKCFRATASMSSPPVDVESLGPVITDLREVVDKWSDVMDTTYDLNSSEVTDSESRSRKGGSRSNRHLAQLL